jgi:hypothetical protein
MQIEPRRYRVKVSFSGIESGLVIRVHARGEYHGPCGCPIVHITNDGQAQLRKAVQNVGCSLVRTRKALTVCMAYKIGHRSTEGRRRVLSHCIHAQLIEDVCEVPQRHEAQH